MKKIYFILITVLMALVLSTLYSCCGNNAAESLCVTYHVSIHSLHPRKLLISYKDATGLKTFYSTDRKWSKEVYLASDDVASLFVDDVFDPENGFYRQEEGCDDPAAKDWQGKPIVIRIVHEKKVLFKAGEGFLHVLLSLAKVGD